MESSVAPKGDVPGPRKRRSSAFYACGCLAIAGGLVVILVATIGIVFAFVPSARWKLVATISSHHALHARIHSEALAAGDANLAYQRSDDRFKAVYSAEQLATYFQNNPELFQVPGSVSMTSQGVNGAQFLSTNSSNGRGKRTEIFVHDSNRQLKLLGISPDLVDAIPEEVRNFKMFDDVFEGDLF